MVLPVSRIMRKKVATCKKNATVYDAVKILKKYHTSTVVIVENKTVLGVFSERDLVNKVVFAKKDPLTTPITEVMSTNPVTANISDTDVTVAALIEKYHITKIPILNKGKLVGIVAEHDLLVHLADSIFEKNE